ncbi:MAG: YtxH domain-containing protein [Anaerolineae bacterium]|nr:YtxH domain-containing protein [Anaerolineae bacterium]
MTDRIYYSREAETRAQQHQLALVLAAAAISLGIGALIALILAPQTGEETRRTLEDHLDDVLDSGKHVASQVRRDVEERVHNARS